MIFVLNIRNMEVVFNNDYLEALYEDKKLKGKPKYTQPIIEKFIKRIDILKRVKNAEELLIFKSLYLERLKGDKNHLYSIRINEQYRLEFELNNHELKIADIVTIEELSKHYEK